MPRVRHTGPSVGRARQLHGLRPALRVGLILAIGAAAAVVLGRWQTDRPPVTPASAYAEDFAYLSRNGNSNCSAQFRESVPMMPDDGMIRGSCCGPMNLHVYGEQRDGLSAKYAGLSEIPQDPYNIPARVAKTMMSHYSDVLKGGEQQAYDYAMANSANKGPCCCKCWRSDFYGGLAKYLIETYGFTGEQVTEVWDFSDGCGGEGNHIYHG